MIIKRFIALFALLSGAAQLSTLHCQLPIERETTHATTFGIGRVKHLDTYLSPLEYKGAQLSFLHETKRNLMRNYHVLFQTITEGEFSMSDSPAKSAKEIGGSARYDAAWYREWPCLVKGLDLAVGGMVGGDLGVLYNNRNGNNPVQVRFNLRLSAAFRAYYHFRIRRTNLALCYQAHLPVFGTTFMPRYGQSYYDIFEHESLAGTIRCTYPGNALSLRQLFTFDIPIRHATLRLGYLSDLRQAKINGIKQHQYGRAFMIGYVRRLSIKR